MLKTIKSRIKQISFLYKPLYYFKYKLVAPIKSGHFLYYMKYTFSLKKIECAKLMLLGIANPKPIHFLDWRIGKGKDHAFRRYYLASYNGKKCFIKIGKNDATVRNEYLTLSKLPKDVIDFSPKILIGKENFDTNTTMLAVEFIEGLEKFTLPKDISTFENLCEQFIHILKVLESQNLVHADIHRGNLMLHNNKLILLDYGISMFKYERNDIDYVARPGTYYRIAEDYRIYDDAYSFTKLIESLQSDFSVETSNMLPLIYQRIDQNSFKVTI